MTDLAVAAFLALRKAFFDGHGVAVPFPLRDKRNTQDDPFDQHIADQVLAKLDGVTCARAPGPLITPDLVLFRPERMDGAGRESVRNDPGAALAIEVKKVERTPAGGAARASGIDYNTTPPCGTVRVHNRRHEELLVRAFYLFVCFGPADPREDKWLSTLVLADGDLLNADLDLYLGTVGERVKAIGLGTYGDGLNRQRPMMVFGNPLAVPLLDRAVTLVHAEPDLDRDSADLTRVAAIVRHDRAGAPRTFHCYRAAADARPLVEVPVLTDPFPTPKRTEATQPRGRFVIPVG